LQYAKVADIVGHIEAAEKACPAASEVIDNPSLTKVFAAKGPGIV
jgi:hypothetical protein